MNCEVSDGSRRESVSRAFGDVSITSSIDITQNAQGKGNKLTLVNYTSSNSASGLKDQENDHPNTQAKTASSFQKTPPFSKRPSRENSQHNSVSLNK